jgi:DNA-binding CsgD family transcriptional regulator
MIGSPLESSVVLLQRVYDAFNARDVEAVVDLHDPDAVIVPRPFAGMPGTSYHGHDGLRTLVEETSGGDIRTAGRSFHSVGAWLMVDLETTASVAGVETTFKNVWLYLISEGRVMRAEGFSTREEAFAVAAWPLASEFGALYQHALEPVLVTDDAGLITDFNPAAAALAPTLRGVPVSTLIAPGAAEGWVRHWEELHATGRVTGLTVIAAAGEERTTSFRAVAHYVPGRHLMMFQAPPGPDISLPPVALLTPREREIFRLLALGYKGPEIADKLFLSPATVRTHVQNGIDRMGAKTRVQALAMAVRSGELEE